jgi:hypothetical protein
MKDGYATETHLGESLYRLPMTLLMFFPSSERQRLVLMIWSLVSGVVHVVWEGTWSLVAPLLMSHSSQHGWWLYWSLYGRADARYLHADPFIRILELVTGTVVAAMNLWSAHQLWRRRRPRSTMTVVLVASVMEVYGTIMYFGSEMLNHWANVDTHSVLHAWGMFFGLNALWLLFPGWCIYEIVAQMAAPGRGGRRAPEIAGVAPVVT